MKSIEIQHNEAMLIMTPIGWVKIGWDGPIMQVKVEPDGLAETMQVIEPQRVTTTPDPEAIFIRLEPKG